MASVNLIKFLDRYVGSFICLILSFFPSKIKKSGCKKILLIQLWGLGETVLSLPSIRELRQKYKNANIDVLTTGRVNDIFYNKRNLNNIRIIKLNPFSILFFILKNWKRYDLVIDMEEYLNISAIIAFFTGKERIGYSHGIRSKLYTKKVPYNDSQHVSQTFMDLLKPLGIDKKVKNLEKLNYSDKDKKKIDSLLKNHNIGKKDFIVGFGIGAAESVRERIWPRERFAAVADYLIEKHKAKIIFIGNKEEERLVDETQKLMKNKDNSLNLAGKTSIREMFYLITLCKLFVGNDAGPMHVAAAQGVRTIGLFGCNLPIRFAPFGKKNISIRKETGKPCINVHKGQVGRCKNGFENACVRKIQVQDVIQAAEKIMEKGKGDKNDED
ncbi:glycosyltransferase family 9 protein [Candidatus Woesearchaeota archaeon]|nr:glycosyltransferase family 9 protein [Candidatus Woesearchaeota archaeon]